MRVFQVNGGHPIYSQESDGLWTKSQPFLVNSPGNKAAQNTKKKQRGRVWQEADTNFRTGSSVLLPQTVCSSLNLGKESERSDRDQVRAGKRENTEQHVSG